MIKVISIVGTRPQFLKLAPLCITIKTVAQIKHIIIHTGQHYDAVMSKNLFETLSLPVPDYLLDINNGSHAEITGKMMIEIEKILIKEQPKYVIVYGDCDTTLAGVITAKKLELSIIHVESGMRSFNKTMPEEINRVIADHISDILLCSTKDSIINLKNENITKNVHYVGNLQLELLKNCLDKYDDKNILTNNNLIENEYILLTIHRHYNTTIDKIKLIFTELSKINQKIIFPIHPRTKNIIIKNNIEIPEKIILINPVNYLDMVVLEKYCYFMITDSGGVQPEAWYLGKKCLVLRSETEWIDAINNNNNQLFNFDNSDILSAINVLLNKQANKFIYDGDCSQNILKIIMENVN